RRIAPVAFRGRETGNRPAVLASVASSPHTSHSPPHSARPHAANALSPQLSPNRTRHRRVAAGGPDARGHGGTHGSCATASHPGTRRTGVHRAAPGSAAGLARAHGDHLHARPAAGCASDLGGATGGRPG